MQRAEKLGVWAIIVTSRIHLRSLLLVLMSSIFVTLLISLTGYVRGLWPLYTIPVFVAALTYAIPGGLAAGLLSAVLIGLTILFVGPGARSALTSQSLAEIGLGMGITVAWGVIVGGQVQRYRDRQQVLRTGNVRDELTGLYAASYFESRLQEEMRRADRYGVGLAVILLEIDDFRSFMDTYGHHKADLVLVRLSELLHLATRDTDIVARRGGEQFAVILPLAQSAEAVAIAERVCETVAGAPFEGDEIQPIVPTTVSCGVAVFPEHAADASALLESALAALRRGKDLGGDRTATPDTSSTQHGSRPPGGRVAGVGP